jgi:hypothetical protein
MLATRPSEAPRSTGKILRRLPAPRANLISVGLRATVNEAIEMARFKDIADILLPIRREHRWAIDQPMLSALPIPVCLVQDDNVARISVTARHLCDISGAALMLLL